MKKYLKRFLFYFIIYILCNNRRWHFLSFYLTIQREVYLLVPHKVILPNEVTILAFHSDMPNTSPKSIQELPQFWNCSVLKSCVCCMCSNILFSLIFQCAYQIWTRNKIPLLRFLGYSGLHVCTQNKAGRLRTAVMPCVVSTATFVPETRGLI